MSSLSLVNLNSDETLVTIIYPISLLQRNINKIKKDVLKSLSLTTKLDRTTETAIKGLAVIMMVFHHFYGFPDWFLSDNQYPFMGDFLNDSIFIWIRNTTVICVGFFSFLTGWNYQHTKTPTLPYSLRKIKVFLKYYWFQVLLIFYPLTILLGYKPSIKHLLLDLFAVHRYGQNVVMFSWYVYFYILVMLTLPFIVKLFTKSEKFNFTIPFFILSLNIFINAYIKNFDYSFILTVFLNYIPTVLMGYLFAKHDIFKYLDKHVKKSLYLHITIILFLVITRKLLYDVTSPLLVGTELNLDWLLVPFIIYSLVNLFSLIKGKLLAFFVFLGEHSLNIWLLHSLFFQVYTKTILQPLVYLPSNPILVVAFAFCMLLPVSMCINYLVKRLP